MNLESTDLRKLVAFYWVVRYGSLQAAADRLRLTAPAVSFKIRSLERDLQIALFNRLPNRLVLTKVGETFAREVGEILDKVESALASVSSARAMRGALTIAVGHDLAHYFTPRITAFAQRYPSIDLKLHISTIVETMTRVEKNEIDVGIGILPRLPKALRSTSLAVSSLSLACPPGHPLARKQDVSLDDLVKHKLLVLPQGTVTRALIDAVFAGRRLAITNCIEVGNCQTAQEFVESGIGISLIHSFCRDSEAKGNVRYVELRDTFGSVDISAVYRKADTSPIVPLLLKELVQDTGSGKMDPGGPPSSDRRTTTRSIRGRTAAGNKRAPNVPRRG
jgi:DNA-binding transcriptional LysR family regulator